MLHKLLVDSEMGGDNINISCNYTKSGDRFYESGHILS